MGLTGPKPGKWCAKLHKKTTATLLHEKETNRTACPPTHKHKLHFYRFDLICAIVIGFVCKSKDNILDSLQGWAEFKRTERTSLRRKTPGDVDTWHSWATQLPVTYSHVRERQLPVGSEGTFLLTAGKFNILRFPHNVSTLEQVSTGHGLHSYFMKKVWFLIIF